MSIYGFATRTPEITPTANDTLIGDFSSYLRWNADENSYQMHSKIDPRVEGDGFWTNISSSVYDAIHPEGGGKTLTVGQLINRLAHQESMHQAEVEAHKKTKVEARNGMDIVGNRLIAESEQRNWCSEYDGIIDETNDLLPHWLQLPTREREYNVTWTEEYSVTVRRHATITARNAEQAAEIASDWDEADSYEIGEAISYGNYSFISDNCDCEVEEA